MAKTCHGVFSESTKERINRERQEFGNNLRQYPCDKCGQHVLPLSTAGEWWPKTHDAPTVRGMKSRSTKR
jgi:hypothetical protein